MNRSLKTLCVATVAIGSSIVGTSPALAATAPVCATGSLPSSVVGSPGLRAHQAAGVYLWHGPSGYALRVTHPGTGRLVVTGTVTVSRDLSHVTGVALERADSVHVSSNRQVLFFRFVNYGGIDGVNFAAECSKTVRVQLRVDNVTASPRQVMLGAHRVHPTSVPFTIERA